MVEKLRYKFIFIATISVFAMLLLALGVINIISSVRNNWETDLLLEYIAANDGYIPSIMTNPDMRSDMENVLTPETQFETRYFSVHIKDGRVEKVNIEHIAALSEQEAGSYALKILGRGQTKGNRLYKDRSYDYLVTKQAQNSYLVVVVDTSRMYFSTMALVRFSATVGIVMIGIFFVMMSVLSRKVLSPIILNIESQKQFITNASHELKTPLAIISANTEVLEMTAGESEWTGSIRHQVERMTGLINRLIALARLQEWGDTELEKINATTIVREVTSSFKTVIEQQKKRCEYNIADEVYVQAEERSFHELVSILIDNAAKYCDDGGLVSVELVQKGRNMFLHVSNTYVEGAGVNYDRFFERFYREDQSHSNEKKGYGIGLAMASEVVKQFKGKLTVSYKNDTITFTVQI